MKKMEHLTAGKVTPETPRPARTLPKETAERKRKQTSLRLTTEGKKNKHKTTNKEPQKDTQKEEKENMQNQNSENIEKHHIPDTLERQIEAFMSEEENMDWTKQRKEEEARWRQTSSRKPTEEKNHSHKETIAEEEEKENSKKTKRARRAGYTNTE